MEGRLSNADAAELLARASNLDALHRASASLLELRAAATEAGISDQAFEGALSELQATRVRRRRLRWPLAAVVAGFLIVGGLTLPWRPTAPLPPTTEGAFLLRCLPATEAADLVRPLVRDAWSTVVINPGHSPRILAVRTTAHQLERIKELMAPHYGPASTPCPLVSPSSAL